MNDQPHEQMIQRKADGAFIPFDPGNKDFQIYKAWLAEGNEPAKAERPPKPEPVEPALDPHAMQEAIESLDERLQALEGDLSVLHEATLEISRVAGIELETDLSKIREREIIRDPPIKGGDLQKG